jgi:DNA-binding GntR family transcriptional regulator
MQMDAKVTRVDVTTLQERVYQELREALFQGRLTAGESMTIRALAIALGTSEMPVREALKRLLAERVLVQAPNRTFRIMPMTPSRLHELTRIRVMVEGEAARLAATGSAALVAELSAVNNGLQAAVARGDGAATLKANQEFHFGVYRAAKSPQLLEIIELLWLRAGPYLAAAFTTPRCDPAELYVGGYKLHARLIRAIAKQDAEAAARALELDLTTAARWYLANGVVTDPDAPRPAAADPAGRPARSGAAAPRKTRKVPTLRVVGT